MINDRDLQAPWVGLTPEQWDKKCGIDREGDDDDCDEADNEND